MTPEDQDCIAMLQDDLIYNDPLYKRGFQAGAASRDAEVVSLTNQRDYEYVRAENAEQERDQLRAEINKLRESTELLLIARQIGHYRDEWDMLKEALAATEPKITKPI